MPWLLWWHNTNSDTSRARCMMPSARHPAGLWLRDAERASCTDPALHEKAAAHLTTGVTPAVTASSRLGVVRDVSCFYWSLLALIRGSLWGCCSGLCWKQWHGRSSYLLRASGCASARAHSCLLSNDVLLKIFVHRFLYSGLASNVLLGAISFALVWISYLLLRLPLLTCALLQPCCADQAHFWWSCTPSVLNIGLAQMNVAKKTLLSDRNILHEISLLRDPLGTTHMFKAGKFLWLQTIFAWSCYYLLVKFV